jgi:hypothetical protein
MYRNVYLDILYKAKIKVKVHPRIGHEGPDGE